MSALQDLLNTYRKAAQTEREKGTYFEELIWACTASLLFEARYNRHINSSEVMTLE